MLFTLKYGRASFSTGARLTLAPLLLFHRSHAGGTHAHVVRAAEKTERESRNAFEREACPQLFPGANLPTGGAAAWHNLARPPRLAVEGALYRRAEWTGQLCMDIKASKGNKRACVINADHIPTGHVRGSF